MPDLLVRSFAPLRWAFQFCFTEPSFRSFWAVSCAWILCSGRRSLTRIIQAAQLSQFKHYCSFHRFFSQARWSLDEVGHVVFNLLLPFCSVDVVGPVDDTLARKSGRHIWGVDMHHAPLRSTQMRPFFSFGHNWVVFSLQVCFAFAPQKHWALPVLARLDRRRKEDQRAPGRTGKLERKPTGQATEKQYRRRPELALEMIRMVAGWVPQRTLRIVGDSGYVGQSISRHLSAHVQLISRMTMQAALYAPAPAHCTGCGRRRKKGPRLLSPVQMTKDPSTPWIKTTLRLSGRRVRVWYKHLDACGIPARVRGGCASWWCVTRGAAGATTASSPPISPSAPPGSWSCFPCAGPWRFAFGMSSSSWVSRTYKTGLPKPPSAPPLSSSTSTIWLCCGMPSRVTY